GVDDRGGVGGKAPEILRDGQLADRIVSLKECLERDRRGALSRPDQLCRVVVDAPMQRIVEMLRLEEARHPVAGLVVDQDGAEKCLFRLKIMGWSAEGRRLGNRGNRANQCIGHMSTLAKTGQGARALGCEQRGELSSLTTSGAGISAPGAPDGLRREAAVARAKLLLGGMKIVAGERQRRLVLGQLQLEDHEVLIAEPGLGACEVELPHAAEALAIALDRSMP